MYMQQNLCSKYMYVYTYAESTTFMDPADQHASYTHARTHARPRTHNNNKRVQAYIRMQMYVFKCMSACVSVYVCV